MDIETKVIVAITTVMIGVPISIGIASWFVEDEPNIVERTCLAAEDQSEKRAAFILECAKAANPMSDEEGEDLVKQCERTADRLYCHRDWAVHRHGRFVACEHADPKGQRDCKLAGWSQ